MLGHASHLAHRLAAHLMRKHHHGLAWRQTRPLLAARGAGCRIPHTRHSPAVSRTAAAVPRLKAAVSSREPLDLCRQRLLAVGLLMPSWLVMLMLRLRLMLVLSLGLVLSPTLRVKPLMREERPAGPQMPAWCAHPGPMPRAAAARVPCGRETARCPILERPAAASAAGQHRCRLKKQSACPGLPRCGAARLQAWAGTPCLQPAAAPSAGICAACRAQDSRRSAVLSGCCGSESKEDGSLAVRACQRRLIRDVACGAAHRPGAVCILQRSIRHLHALLRSFDVEANPSRGIQRGRAVPLQANADLPSQRVSENDPCLCASPLDCATGRTWQLPARLSAVRGRPCCPLDCGSRSHSA